MKSLKSIFSPSFILTYFALPSTANRASFLFSSDCRDVNGSLLTVLAGIFQSREFFQTFHTSSLSMKEFLRSAGRADTASWPRKLAVLRRKTDI